MRIGVAFTDQDVERLRAQPLDGVLIAPTCPLDEKEIQDNLGLPVFDLNDFVQKGEMSELSRSCAYFIRRALEGIDLPLEARASQNDIYQYHLRKQFLFVTALERYLKTLDHPFVLVFPFENLLGYVSPMRPELNILFNDFRTFGYLAKQLAKKYNGSCAFSKPKIPALGPLQDRIIQLVRGLAMQAYIILKLLKKILCAKKHVKRNAKTFLHTNDADLPLVGIIVRTDSEVISATQIIEKLQDNGLGYFIIQDELLASQTTSQRLESLNLTYFPIGGALGASGIFKAFAPPAYASARNIAKKIAQNLRGIDPTLPVADRPLAHWMAKRLLDFRFPQRHFGAELKHLIQCYDLKLLITFAYVDQWGPVMRDTGDELGINTLCVQNAAQDPEEYPKLAWSSHYCVESKYLKEKLQSFGYPSEQISATGLPHFTSGSISQDDLKDTSDKAVILLVTQPIYHSYYLQLIHRLSAICAQNDYELHIKYHPRQLGTEYSQIIAENAGTCTIKVFHREGLDELLEASRLCISVVSAAILRALNLGVPTISFLPKSEKYLDIYYCSDENLFVAEDYDVLESIILRAENAYADFWQDFRARRQHYLDLHLTIEPEPDASENIFKVITAHLPKEVSVIARSIDLSRAGR